MEPDVTNDLEDNNDRDDSSHNNNNDGHSTPPLSTSVGSIAQAAGDAFLETNPANFV